MNLESIPILYSFRRCPYAMRARLALAHAGISVELREIVLKDKPEEMLAISPKGTVPVMQLSSGEVIDESFEIFQWALDAGGLSPQEVDLVHLVDGDFKQALDRYKYFVRMDETEEAKTAEDYRDAAIRYLLEIDRFLNSHESPMLELAIFPFLRQFRGVDDVWFDNITFTVLHVRLSAFLSSDLFKRVMKKYQPWKPEDEPTIVLF